MFPSEKKAVLMGGTKKEEKNAMKKMNIINKEYLLGLLFLAGLTGCSSDDSNDATTPEEQGTPIAFSANQSEESDPNTAALGRER